MENCETKNYYYFKKEKNNLQILELLSIDNLHL